MTRPIAVYTPRDRTVTVITDGGTFPIHADQVLEVADRLDMAADMTWLAGVGAMVRTRISAEHLLVIDFDDARDLAASIRDAFAIPAHIAKLNAESAV